MKPVQDLRSLLLDERVDKVKDKSIYFLSEAKSKDLTDKIFSNEYILESGITYIIKKLDDTHIGVVGDGVNVFSNCLQIEANSAEQPISWEEIENKPTDYLPAAHTHPMADIEGIQDALDEIERRLEALEALEAKV